MTPRRPGQYLREQLRKFWKLMVLAVIAPTLAGLVLWLVLGHRTPLWPLLVSAPLIAIVMLWRDQEMRHWLRNHRRGAEGEERVGRLLSQKLDNSYKVFHDLDMRHGNLDHLVIGPTGAFAIETKAWTGRVWLGRHGKLMVGGRDEESTLGRATHEAMWAHQLLSDAGIDVWVEAVIVLTHTSLSKGPIDRRSVRIVPLDDLVSLLHAGRHRVPPHEIVRAANAVLGAGVPVEGRRRASFQPVNPS